MNIAIDSKLSTFNNIDMLKSNSHYVIAIQSINIFFLEIKNVIFGTGINCLNVYFQEIYNYEIMKAHNYFLQRLCETGIIGFIMFCYYLQLLFSQCRSHSKESVLLKTMLITMLSMNFTYDAFSRDYNLIFIVFTSTISTKYYGYPLSRSQSKQRSYFRI